VNKNKKSSTTATNISQGEAKMKAKKIVFITLGCVTLALGSIGIVLPILPTVPFYLLTVFFFANSSEKLHEWFVNTKVYKKHLDSFVKKKGMPLKTKIGIITTVTLLMGFGFFMMLRKLLSAGPNVGLTVGCVVLAIVWACHIVYFFFGVKTVRPGELPDAETEQTTE